MCFSFSIRFFFHFLFVGFSVYFFYSSSFLVSLPPHFSLFILSLFFSPFLFFFSFPSEQQESATVNFLATRVRTTYSDVCIDSLRLHCHVTNSLWNTGQIIYERPRRVQRLWQRETLICRHSELRKHINLFSRYKQKISCTQTNLVNALVHSPVLPNCLNLMLRPQINSGQSNRIANFV